jgi:hypothetical protein
MPKLCLAILAHNNPACLADFLDNVRAFAPAADVVLFNGGRDPDLARGLDVEICPYSRPLGYERVAPFHYEIMRWLHEQRRRYDILVTLDADMLLIKPGLETYLEQRLGESAYMAVLFRNVPPDTRWVTGRRFHLKWRNLWQPIFGTDIPYGCFNPGQTFRREYAERLLKFPKLEELLRRIERSSLRDLEEMVWATMAVTLECAPREYPWSVATAVRYVKRHSPVDIQNYLADPDVFFIHPVTMRLDAPERRLIRLLREGQPVDYAILQREFDAFKVTLSPGKRARMSLVSPVLSALNDAYLRLAPE